MEKKCLYCKKVFKTTSSQFHKRKYCSWQCISRVRGGQFIYCAYCKKRIWRCGRDIRKKGKYLFCNRVCYHKFYKGHRTSPETEFKGKFGNWRKTPKGVHCSPKTEFKNDHIPWNKGKGNPKAKELKRFRTKLRKARLKKIPGSHTLKEWEELKKKYNYSCVICGKQEPFKNQKYQQLTEDHIFPVSREGSTNYISNIQPVCMKCNIGKRDKIINK